MLDAYPHRVYYLIRYPVGVYLFAAVIETVAIS